MKEITLKSTEREVTGKKVRFLRRQGITPAHLFGHNIKSLPLQCQTTELQHTIALASTTKLVGLKIDDKQPKSIFIREIQRNATTGELLHVDFYQVRKGEKIKAEIPIILVGEAPAMRLKGRMLSHTLYSLNIECLPEKLPPQAEVDLSRLEEVEQAIHVRDIVLGPDITVLTGPEQMVVKVVEAPAAEIEEVAPAAEVVAEAAEEAPAAEEEGKPERPAR